MLVQKRLESGAEKFKSTADACKWFKDQLGFEITASNLESACVMNDRRTFDVVNIESRTVVANMAAKIASLERRVEKLEKLFES